MKGRLRVVVATTDGPATVRRITAEDPDLRSVVCLAGTATALAVSTDYDAFVRRPTGVVERAVGHAAFRVDIDAPIDQGRSWQLGLYLAHRLKAAGRLAEDEEDADGILWATGIVDSDLRVGTVERVADKVRRSAALFSGPLPVLVVVPSATAGDLPAGLDHVAAERVDDVLERLALVAPTLASPPPPRARWWMPLAALGLLGAGAAVWQFWPVLQEVAPKVEANVSPPAKVSSPVDPVGAEEAVNPAEPVAAPPPAPAPPFDPGAVALDVLEARRSGGGCGTAAAVDTVLESAPGVCAAGFRATNTGAPPAHIWLYGAVQGTFREYATRGRYFEMASGSLAPGESAQVVVQPPDWVKRAVIVRGILILAATRDEQMDQAFASLETRSADEVDTLIADLRGRGLAVRDVSHRIVPGD